MSVGLSNTMAEIAAALDERQSTARELIEAAIARHERWDERLHAYSLWTPEIARAAADAADAAFSAGLRVGSLQGIPISVKDLFGVAGLPTFAGTPRRLPAAWEHEGPLVATVRRQLSAIVGKTHMVEFAFGGTGANHHWGCPTNPWDPHQPRSPGGSSSGAGVSLAEGSALLAFGSDTAGSVRIPASATGHVGLKVTGGRWSCDGLVPLSRVFDTPGILVRSVADAVYAFGALDPAWGDARAFERTIAGCDIDGVRIGVGDPSMWADCAPGIAEAARAALDQLAKAGARIAPKTVPAIPQAYSVFAEGGVSGPDLRALLDLELPEWIPLVDPLNAPIIAAMATLPVSVYLGRHYRLAKLARSADAQLADVDVIACPTLCLAPPRLADIRDSDSHWAANRKLTRNTVPANYLGLCAVTLPVGRDREGMPVGLQLTARGGQEERLLAIAWAAERVLGRANERIGAPPLLAT